MVGAVHAHVVVECAGFGHREIERHGGCVQARSQQINFEKYGSITGNGEGMCLAPGDAWASERLLPVSLA